MTTEAPAPAADIRIDALISADPLRWNVDNPYGTGIRLTFSFPTTAPAHAAEDDLVGWRPFSSTEIAAARTILRDLSLVVGIDFVEVEGVGDLVFANNFNPGVLDGGYAGYAYLPNSTGSASDGDVFMNHSETERLGEGAYAPGGRQLSTLVHEIGHALGLKHPRDYQPREPIENKTDVPPFLPEELDTSANTVMTYVDPALGNQRVDFGPFDILALQFLYGARRVAEGNDVYRFTDADGATYRTLHDNGGVDTIDLSALSSGASLDLRAGALSGIGISPSGAPNTGNISIMLDNPRAGLATLIENAIGTALADTIVGNSAANRFTPGAGADRVDGLGGLDVVVANVQRGEATAARTAAADWTVTLPDGADTLVNVERIVFADGVLALDIELGTDFSNAGTAYRMYQAAFARTPDAGGLGFWINALDKGLSVRDLAGGFVTSAEFAQTYGAAPTTEALVDGFYRNILGREAEAGGRAFWIGVMESGPTGRYDALAGIANSAENQERLLPTIGQGIFLPGDALVA